MCLLCVWCVFFMHLCFFIEKESTLTLSVVLLMHDLIMLSMESLATLQGLHAKHSSSYYLSLARQVCVYEI